MAVPSPAAAPADDGPRPRAHAPTLAIAAAAAAAADEAADVAVAVAGAVPFGQLAADPHALALKVDQAQPSFLKRNQVRPLSFPVAPPGFSSRARELLLLPLLKPTSVKLPSADVWRASLRSSVTEQHLMEFFIAGGLAGATSRTVVSPLERLKIIMCAPLDVARASAFLQSLTLSAPLLGACRSRRQVQSSQTVQTYTGVWPSLKKMWREEGWRGYMKVRARREPRFPLARLTTKGRH